MLVRGILLCRMPLASVSSTLTFYYEEVANKSHLITDFRPILNAASEIRGRIVSEVRLCGDYVVFVTWKSYWFRDTTTARVRI